MDSVTYACPLTKSPIVWQNGKAETYLKEHGGGKSGATQFLHDTQHDLRKHLPAGLFLEPGGDLGSFLDKIPDDSTAKVIRACHPLDVVGMVDVLPTEFSTYTDRISLEQRIEMVLDASRGPKFKSYMEYETGNPFDGKVGILVQDHGGDWKGSMIEHPHEKGIYRIMILRDSIDPEYRSSDRSAYWSEELVDVNGNILDLRVMADAEKASGRKSPPIYKPSTDQPKMKRLVDLYRAIQDSGLMPASHSFQMEFGIKGRTEPPLFYQARIFRPFQAKADYELIGDSARYNSYGITKPEGEEFEVVPLDTAAIRAKAAHARLGYGNRARYRKSAPHDVQPRNMALYVTPETHTDNHLEHGHFRWLQRSPLAICGVYPYWRVEPFDEGKVLRMKVTSDGINHETRFLSK